MDFELYYIFIVESDLQPLADL